MDGDAAHDRACRLHLVADDRDLGAHEAVDQCRLAGVGWADESHETRMRRADMFNRAVFGGRVLLIAHFFRHSLESDDFRSN